MHRKTCSCGASAAAACALAALLAWPAAAQAEAPAANANYDLARCLSEAVTNNFEIRKARERIARQEGAQVEVRSRMLPNVGVVGQGAEVDENRIQNFGPVSGNSQSWYLDAQVTQSFYAGGGNRARYREAEALSAAARLDLETRIRDTLQLVRERYLGVLLARSDIGVQEESVRLLQEELDNAKRRYEAGVVSPFEVLRAEVALANGQSPLIRARNAYRVSVEELIRVIGMELSPFDAFRPPIRIVGELAYSPVRVPLAEALTSALEHRSELMQLEQVIESREYALDAARAGRLPSLDGFAAYGSESDRLSDDDVLSGWKAGLSVKWNVWDGAGTRGRVMQAASDLSLARLDYSQAFLDIETDVRRTHASVEDARELVAATEKVIEQAVESLRLARSRYESGAATQLDVLAAEVALTEARSNEIRSLHDHNVALSRLYKAMGIGDRVVVTSVPVSGEK
jgi:outer membrane protein